MAWLELREVQATRGGHRVLTNFEVSVEAGQVHAILGERRSGKTSLAMLLAGAARLEHGSIEVGGQGISKIKPRSMIRSGIGILFQEASLIPSLNACENVLVGRKTIGARAFRELAAADAQIQAVAARWGLKFDTRIPGRRLSLIESSVVELVRAMAFNSSVLLLDEPAGRFTADELKILYDIVKEERNSGKAVIYIASTVDEVFHVADFVSVMRHGTLIDTQDIHSLDRERLVDKAYSFTESREELIKKNIELVKYYRYSEEIVSNLPIGSVILDTQEKIYLINLAARMALGGDLSGNMRTPEDLSGLLACVEESVRGSVARSVREGLRGSWDRVATRDGRSLHLLAFPFHDSSGLSLGTILTVEDVTQSIITQEYLVRAERASSIAQLAAGVAHEVNNPLAIISNYVELLLMRNQENYTQERLQIIRDEIRRIHGIVVSLLSFAAIGSSCLEETDLVSVANEGLRLLSHEAELRGVVLRGELPRHPVIARADASRIKQIIINLVINALEAVHGGGIITLSLRHETDSTGASVVLEIEDNGPGIPAVILESLFEPFVRGDKPKPHAGLGLSVCKHIVQAHGGSISCESIPGRTLFSVRLPEQGPPDSSSSRMTTVTAEVFHG